MASPGKIKKGYKKPGKSNAKGNITYYKFDGQGRPTGVEATIVEDMIGTGSKASQSIVPPGFLGGSEHARGHLLGRQLGGSGTDARNLVTLYQNPVNTPAMSGHETRVREAVEDSQIVTYKSIHQED